MSKITLYNEQSVSATYIPNVFIDEYMTQANGEYVKVYLYLLRSISQLEQSFSLSSIADHFDCTERDVLRALKYWEKLRLFRLEYDENSNLSGICFLTDALSVTPAAVKTEPVDLADRFIQAAAPAKSPCSKDQLREFSEKEDVRELVFIAEQYLGRTLNQTDLQTIFCWYDDLQFSAELIEFLIENCVAKGHTSLHYMQRVAEDYSARGIHTVEEAKEMINRNSAIYYAVMKAFGIRGRNLVPSETNFLKIWSVRLGFNADLIAEACSRTIRSIHEPSFGYANSILEKWHKQGIHTMEDVKKSDEAYQAAQQQHPKRAKAPAGTSSNRFINFKQRDNNYDEIQKALVKKSLQ